MYFSKTFTYIAFLMPQNDALPRTRFFCSGCNYSHFTRGAGLGVGETREVK